MRTPSLPRKPLRRTAVAAGVTALLATALTAASPANTSATCTPTWTLEQAPTPAASAVPAVDVLDRDNVLLADSRIAAGNRMLSWDGTSVRETAQQIPVPPGTEQKYFTTSLLSFDSPSSGWAKVSGALSGGLNVANPAARWDGIRWTLVPTAVSPDPAAGDVSVRDILSVAPDDAWMVGSVATGSALVEHWDGRQWSAVSTPVVDRPRTDLASVHAGSPTDVWAAGSQRNADGESVPLLLHYDGTAWQEVATPTDLGEAWFTDVQVLGPDDVWLAGATGPSGDDSQWHPLLMHWDGEQWDIDQAAPTGDVGLGRIRTIYAANSTTVWAIVEAFRSQPVLARLDDSGWTEVKPQGTQPAEYRYVYQALDGAGPNEVWAVGQAFTPEPASGPISLPQVRSGQLLGHLTCGGK